MGKVVAIYHKDCNDGTTAAAVVLRRFPEAQLFPLRHAYTAEDIKPIIDLLDSDTECYTVDCGLGVEEMLKAGCKVTTIDHHIGAKELFEKVASEYENYTYIFDNEKSGASLTWFYLFPDGKMPELIKYVEDSDLWNQQYGDTTKHVGNYLSMFRNDPKAVLGFIDGDLEDIKKKGEIITMYADRQVSDLVLFPSLDVKVGEWIVPAYNIPVYVSAVGNNLSSKLDSAVMMFTILGDKVKFSFRSKDGQDPTSLTLAQVLGGGGHQNTAGGTISLEQFLQMIVR